MKAFQFLWIFGVFFPVLLIAQDTKEAGNACLDLRTGKILEARYCVKPDGPIIWGNLEKEGFDPSHSAEFVERAMEPDPKFTPGWMELRTGQIHQDMEGRGPQTPYLRGGVDPKGWFYVYPDELRKWSQQKEPVAPTEPLPVAPRTEKPGAFAPAAKCDSGLVRLPTVDLLQGYNEENRGRMTTARSIVISQRRIFEVRPDAFSIVRNEGRVFATGMLQPPGTIPLYSWHLIQRTQRQNLERLPLTLHAPEEHHLKGVITSSPALSGSIEVVLFRGESETRDLLVRQEAGPIGAGWEFQGIEGYIFADSCPDTLPLYGWYNAQTNDYITTTDSRWSGRVGDTRDGYHMVRIEGYVLPPR